MAKKYDIIVVGAGPAGLVAAKAVGENGFEVALLERKTDLTVMDRACGQTLDSANEYLHHDLYRCNVRDKRLCFPAHGFSVKYDGPYRKAYSTHIYSPGGNKIQMGITEEQKAKGDYGMVTAVPDKEILFQCLLEEAKACSVDVFPGINVMKVTPTAEGVTVEGSGQSFDGKYLIAADGVNSRIAQMLGMNEGRTYYCQLRAISHYVSGVEPPDPDAVIAAFGFMKDGPVQLFLFPKPPEGEYNHCVVSPYPGLDLEAASNYLMTEAFCAPWYKNAKVLRTFSANENIWTPMIKPYKGRVLATGDVGVTQEIEITGAMICGWKAGNAASVALQEENLGLEITALTKYADWWQEAYVNYYDPDVLIKTFVLALVLEPEDIDYLFSLLKEPMPASFNPYIMGDHQGHAMTQVMPIIQQERPELLQKLVKGNLPVSDLLADITRMSKPIF
jgi:digeranylgeranylglycerophospholipid reductase